MSVLKERKDFVSRKIEGITKQKGTKKKENKQRFVQSLYNYVFVMSLIINVLNVVVSPFITATFLSPYRHSLAARSTRRFVLRDYASNADENGLL